MHGVWTWSVIVTIGLCAACASKPDIPAQTPLGAPAGATAEARTAVTQGSAYFAAGQWNRAREQYEQALAAQPDLAEAHYNLALTLDRMGDTATAKRHYIEAANLAPGHKIIWNSPPLRRYGNVPDKPVENTSAPVLPSIGGSGLGGGGVGGRGF